MRHLYAKFDEPDSDLYLANIKSFCCMAWTDSSVYLRSFYDNFSASCVITTVTQLLSKWLEKCQERTWFPKTRLVKEATTMASREFKKDFVSCSAPHHVKLLAVRIQTAFQRFISHESSNFADRWLTVCIHILEVPDSNLDLYLEGAGLLVLDLYQKLPEWHHNIKNLPRELSSMTFLIHQTQVII